MRKFGFAFLLATVGVFSTAAVALADWIGPHVPTP
jgi:hypothetical protein